jgi:hypothetical protein
MATFIDLDSIFRDKDQFPNPNDYELFPNQVDSWFNRSRIVRKFADDPSKRPVEFVVTLNIKYLTLPYSEELAILPRVYVEFYSQKYKDMYHISTIDGGHVYAKFICIPDRIQNDTTGDPLWIHYKCTMEQTMRFERNFPISFKITSRSDDVLPSLDSPEGEDPDPTKQTLCTLEMTTYLRDGDYSNHNVEPL